MELDLGSVCCREKENEYMWVYRVEGRCLGKKRVGHGMENEKRQVQQVAMKVKRGEFRGSWAGLESRLTEYGSQGDAHMRSSQL